MYITNPAGENELALSFRILKRYLFSYVLVLNVSCLLIFLVFVGCQLFFFSPFVSCQLTELRPSTLHDSISFRWCFLLLLRTLFAHHG